MAPADRFHHTLTELGASHTGSTPMRLCLAAVSVLPFDGAGLSTTLLAPRRLPLAASSPAAAEAERLQFTLGIGPCTVASRTRSPVAASHHDLEARWPAYTAELAQRTPYRSNLALPVGGPLSAAVVLDLYSTQSQLPHRGDLHEVIAISDAIGAVLAEDLASGHDIDLGLPAALRSAPIAARQAVWTALGVIAQHHDVDNRTALSLLRARAFSQHTDLETIAATILETGFDTT